MFLYSATFKYSNKFIILGLSVKIFKNGKCQKRKKKNPMFWISMKAGFKKNNYIKTLEICPLQRQPYQL